MVNAMESVPPTCFTLLRVASALFPLQGGYDAVSKQSTTTTSSHVAGWSTERRKATPSIVPGEGSHATGPTCRSASMAGKEWQRSRSRATRLRSYLRIGRCCCILQRTCRHQNVLVMSEHTCGAWDELQLPTHSKRKGKGRPYLNTALPTAGLTTGHVQSEEGVGCFMVPSTTVKPAQCFLNVDIRSMRSK